MKSLLTAKASTIEEPREGKLHAGIFAGGEGLRNWRSYRDCVFKMASYDLFGPLLKCRTILHISFNVFSLYVDISINYT